MTRLSNAPLWALATAVGALLGGCADPDAVPSAALDVPADLVVMDFCVLTCTGEDVAITTRDQCASETPCGTGTVERSSDRSFAVIANAGDAQLHVLDLDRSEPAFRDYNPGIPGVTGVPVAADPELLALHADAGHVWVVSSGVSDDPDRATATPELRVVDAVYGEALDPSLALPEMPSAIAPIPGSRSLAVALPNARALWIVEDVPANPMRLLVQQRLPLGRAPRAIAAGDDGRVYVVSEGRTAVDVVDPSVPCDSGACLVSTLEAPATAALGLLTYVPATASPQTPALLLVTDRDESQVLVFDLATGALVDANSGNGLRDLVGIGVSTRVITEVSAWTETTTSDVELASATLTTTTVERRAVVTTSGGYAHLIDLDQAETYALNAAEPFYSRYVPALHRRDSDGSSAEVVTAGCVFPEGADADFVHGGCRGPLVPSLRPVDCDAVNPDTSDYDGADAFVGLCQAPIATPTCPTDEEDTETIGGCCVAGACEAEALTETACAAAGGVFSEAVCEASWCGTEAIPASAGVCGWEPGVNTDLELVGVFPHINDINVASDSWHLVWEGVIPGSEREDGWVETDADGTWVHFGLLAGCDAPELFCGFALQTDCSLAETLCDSGVDLCDGTQDLCERCPELCPEEDLCSLGLEAHVDTDGAAQVGDLLMVVPIERSAVAACAGFVGDVDEPGFGYEITAVQPTGVQLGMPADAPDTLPPLEDFVDCFSLGTDAPALATYVRVPDQWLLYGERLGVESPYERDGDACVVSTDPFAQDSRPVEGQRFVSRWGFELLLDPATEVTSNNDPLPSDFEIYFRTDSQFAGRTLSTGASPSGIGYADTLYGPRFVIADSGSDLVLVYSGSTYLAVTDPIY